MRTVGCKVCGVQPLEETDLEQRDEFPKSVIEAAAVEKMNSDPITNGTFTFQLVIEGPFVASTKPMTEAELLRSNAEFVAWFEKVMGGK